jgi:Ca2+-binding RTX toxin-like protein
MILLLLIPLAFALAISSAFDDEIQRVADQNGLGGFDPEEPSIFDDRETIFGTNTSETLIGTEGNDALFALGQADIVRGLSGDDLIDAGTNNDTVFGGAGIDRFILNEDMADENTVLIADFTAGEDVIALEYNGTTAPEIDIRDRAENAVIFIGEDVIAIIEGGVGLVASDIRLVQTT